MAKLTAKQKRFIEEYLIDLNATQAAIRAGYSEKTARSQGQRLLTNVDIQNAIKDLREEIQNDNIAKIKDIEEFLSLSMNGLINEEVIVVEGVGDGFSSAKTIEKQISAKDRIKAAELLGKRYSLFTDKMDLSVEKSEKLADIINQLGGEGLEE